MYSNLLSRIRTQEEAIFLSEEVENLLTSLYKNGEEGFLEALKNKVRLWVSELIAKDILNKGTSEREKYLKDLKGEIRRFETIKLSLAFEPTDNFVDRLYAFITNNGNKKIVLDISYQPKILGGCLITSRGFYRDYSLAKTLEKEFETNRDLYINLLSK